MSKTDDSAAFCLSELNREAVGVERHIATSTSSCCGSKESALEA
jgi:hypothetical protein